MQALDQFHISTFAEGLDHPECVAVHQDGTLWAGGEAGQIYRISANGESWQEVANTGGFILGLAFSPGCDWLAICDSKSKCVWKLDPNTYALSLFSNGSEDHPFNIPNYAVFDSLGNLYVSESGAFNATLGKILKFNPAGVGEVWHAGPFQFANGMALNQDQSYLYVVCSWLPGIERISVNADGSAGSREIFTLLPRTVPDGVALTADGKLYVSCYTPNAIYEIAPDGSPTVLMEDWEAHTLSNPTNIAFGGEEMDQLYTANLGRWHINKIDLKIKGLPLASHRKSPKNEL